MDPKQLYRTVTVLFPKFKYAFLVLLIGILFMVLPEKKQENPIPIPSAADTASDAADLQESLSALLSQMDGAGQVRVLLSQLTGPETYFQVNESRTSDENGSTLRTEAVVLTDSGRNQSGMIQKISPPTFRGAVVLCQGAKNAQVRLSVAQAVANATGLGFDKITVLKMK